jgi:hypothetical protein
MAIEKDLEELKSLALGKGAASSEVIPAHEVVFDERAHLGSGLDYAKTIPLDRGCPCNHFVTP